MSRYKGKFEIGDSVTVTATCSMMYDDSLNRHPARIVLPSPRTGVIVGARYRRQGRWHGGTVQGVDQDYDPPYLETYGRKSVLVWLVATSVTGIPMEVLEADVSPVDSKVLLPWFRNPQPEWTPEARKRLSKEVQSAPRDKRGRFIRY